MTAQKKKESLKRSRSSVPKILKILGPGLITGAADDDPSGIATYSSVGAQFGYAMLWTMPFIYPFMAAIQEISARIGRVTGRGIAGNMRNRYPRWLLYCIVGLLLFANVINLGADIGAMGAAVNLLIGGPAAFYCVLLTVLSLLLQIWIPYRKYAAVLKWLTLSLFAYVATAFVVRIDWFMAVQGTFVPNIAFTSDYLQAFVAVLGTTISPYLFFWQSSEEVEELESVPREKALKRAPRQGAKHLQRIKLDTYLGMAFSNLIGYFIILTVAVTLNAHGKTDIESAEQAAEALRPIAGPFASLLFSLGIIGTGLLALPVLAGAGAYAIGEALRWPVGLERKASEAKAFYGVLALSTIIGLVLNFIGINPIRALVWSAIINGVTAAPIMCFIMLMATSRKVMGGFTLPLYLKVFGWGATLVMAAAAVGMLWPTSR
ncbi:MAG: divalent metal cation transporter [Verrucomicrobia bacterium]|nr:divalent metal cation transporter [Verrucomicrobiota bacterium]MBV8483887.1 divalent metal cation transporter [Verrucomicrobiota bacterium]